MIPHTVARKKEVALMQNALREMFDSGFQMQAGEVPNGSMVLVRHVEPEADEDEATYQVFIVFRKTKNIVYVAYLDDGDLEDGFKLSSLDHVVILNPQKRPLEPQPFALVEETQTVVKGKTGYTKEEVQKRGGRVVILSVDGEREYYLSKVRHNKYGRPTFGMVENGGWGMLIDPEGDVRNGRFKAPMFNLGDFECIYVPHRVWNSRRNHEHIIEWAKKLPKDFRVKHSAKQVVVRTNKVIQVERVQ